MVLAQRERQQQQRLMLGVAANDDERAGAFVLADQTLPGTEQIKPLIGREEVPGLLEGAPDGPRLRRDRSRCRHARCGPLSTALAILPSGFASPQPWSFAKPVEKSK